VTLIILSKEGKTAPLEEIFGKLVKKHKNKQYRGPPAMSL
jgi:hypothetical protein